MCREELFVLINSWQLSFFGKDVCVCAYDAIWRETESWTKLTTTKIQNLRFEKKNSKNLTCWILASYKEGRYVLYASCSYTFRVLLIHLFPMLVDVRLSSKILNKRKNIWKLKCSDFCWVFRCRVYVRASSLVLILLPPPHLLFYFTRNQELGTWFLSSRCGGDVVLCFHARH